MVYLTITLMRHNPCFDNEAFVLLPDAPVDPSRSSQRCAQLNSPDDECLIGGDGTSLFGLPHQRDDDCWPHPDPRAQACDPLSWCLYI